MAREKLAVVGHIRPQMSGADEYGLAALAALGQSTRLEHFPTCLCVMNRMACLPAPSPKLSAVRRIHCPPTSLSSHALG